MCNLKTKNETKDRIKYPSKSVFQGVVPKKSMGEKNTILCEMIGSLASFKPSHLWPNFMNGKNSASKSATRPRSVKKLSVAALPRRVQFT